MKKNIFIMSAIFAFAFSAITTQAVQWSNYKPSLGTAAALGSALSLGAYYGPPKI